MRRPACSGPFCFLFKSKKKIERGSITQHCVNRTKNFVCKQIARGACVQASINELISRNRCVGNTVDFYIRASTIGSYFAHL